MSPNPPPRPALRKAADAGVHPAAPRPVGVPTGSRPGADGLNGPGGPNAPDGEVPSVPAPAPGKKKHAAKDDSPVVELVVPLTKDVRKRLKAKAGEHGMSAPDAVAYLVRVWLDG